jgi:hypothetical protein
VMSAAYEGRSNLLASELICGVTTTLGDRVSLRG